MTWKLPSFRAMPETLSRSQRSLARKFTRAFSSSTRVTGSCRKRLDLARHRLDQRQRLARLEVRARRRRDRGRAASSTTASSRSPSRARSFTLPREPRALALAEHEREQVEQRRVRVREARPPASRARGRRARTAAGSAERADLALRRLGLSRALRAPPRRDAGEGALDGARARRPASKVAGQPRR